MVGLLQNGFAYVIAGMSHLLLLQNLILEKQHHVVAFIMSNLVTLAEHMAKEKAANILHGCT
jgi:hypothetical protein